MSEGFEIGLGTERIVLDASGALWWPRERTLVFSDLHLEKGSSFARTGQLLPPYDSRATLLRMAEAAARFRPGRIVALGDSFHDSDAADRLGETDRELLMGLTRDSSDGTGRPIQWIWIAGNHDPAPPAWLGGERHEQFALGGLCLRHEPSIAPGPGEVAGHLHPCARVGHWGRSVRRRCFLSDGHRLVLPAFGAYAGGLDVGEDAILALFGDNFHAYLLGRARVYAVAQSPIKRPIMRQAMRRKMNEENQPRKIAISTVDRP